MRATSVLCAVWVALAGADDGTIALIAMATGYSVEQTLPLVASARAALPACSTIVVLVDRAATPRAARAAYARFGVTVLDAKALCARAAACEARQRPATRRLALERHVIAPNRGRFSIDVVGHSWSPEEWSALIPPAFST